MNEPSSCPYRPPCPGCPRFGQAELPSEGWALLQGLAERQGLGSVEAVTGEAFGSRHRVKLSVRGVPGDVRVGIFEEGSHRIVNIPDCPLHHPAITEVLSRLIPLLNRDGIEPYDEARHRGVLRTLQLAVERGTGKVQLVFVVRDKLGPGSHAARQLRSILGELGAWSEKIHSLWLNAQPDKTNTLLGEHFEQVMGLPFIEDRSGGASVFYAVSAFGQANPVLHDAAVERIQAWVPEGARLVELHAGVGTIGLGLVERCSVTFNEIGVGSLQGLRQGLDRLARRSPGLRTAEDGVPRIAPGSAEEHLELLDEADVVIVDPPRKGLSKALLDKLCVSPPRRLIYLSCGLGSFHRDAELLLERAFTLSSLSGFGYFPFTEHIETLALFERR